MPTMRIKLDPVTRIEGHLRLEAEVESGHVTQAWASGTMFRGLELILRGKDPRGAWIWAQRICGVCTTVHALASVRAVENALGIDIPPNANLVRNVIAGTQTVHDHVVHFYQLHALDWVDITSALRADPAKTSRLAQSISDWPQSGADQFAATKTRIKTLADSGQLSLFSSGYWGHPAYRLDPEANLLAVDHYLQALEWQRDVIRVHAVLGGKNPHPQTYLVGGMATPLDINSPQAVNGERIGFMLERIKTMRQFVEQVYLPDVLFIASAYKEWFSIGGNTRNFLAYGGIPLGTIHEPAKFFFPRGILYDRDLSAVHSVEEPMITEQVARSYYEYSDGDAAALNPFAGETNPTYTGPKPPYQWLDANGKYSWLKSPRYDGHAMEVGPLARLLVAYASGRENVQRQVDKVLTTLGAKPEALFSTLGRVAARAIESVLLSQQLETWMNELESNLAAGDLRNTNTARWDPATWPNHAEGYGWHEAPRGSLGHWVVIENGTIHNYQAVVPTTWNSGPRDSGGQPGPYEQALVGVPVADPTRPLELLRTVHSFDPCLACAVHVLGAAGAGAASQPLM
jgi:Ni,Fe-hydrogenase I large subunit